MVGTIIKNYNGYYYVEAEQTLYECKLRGKLKGQRQKCLVGDRVEFEPLEAGHGVIERCLPRISSLRRPAVANVTQILVVMAAKDPDPNTTLLDKLLASIEHAGIQAYICINKSDLDPKTAAAYKAIYEKAGYNVFLVSAKDGTGLEDIRTILNGHITALAGPSGVGKSSLLRHIAPHHEFATGAVSEKIGRGKHTTRHSELVPLSRDSFIVDTPGFSVLEFSHLDKSDVIHLFPDIERYRANCRFHSCLHRAEPDCAVKTAVEEGAVAESRYETYCAILDEILMKKR